jgi:hypothetical protein
MPNAYNWVRNHPCVTPGSGPTFTTTFDHEWMGNKLRRHWDNSNRKVVARSGIVLQCADAVLWPTGGAKVKIGAYAMPTVRTRNLNIVVQNCETVEQHSFFVCDVVLR